MIFYRAQMIFYEGQTFSLTIQITVFVTSRIYFSIYCFCPQNEEVDEKASAVLPSGLMDQLADPKWKERLEACDKFKQVQLIHSTLFIFKNHIPIIVVTLLGTLSYMNCTIQNPHLKSLVLTILLIRVIMCISIPCQFHCGG